MNEWVKEEYNWSGTSLVGPVAKTLCSQWRGLGSILGQGTRSHMPELRVHMPRFCLTQLKILSDTMKIKGPTNHS